MVLPQMNILNGFLFEMFILYTIFYTIFCDILRVSIFHFVKSGTFVVKVGQEVGQKWRILMAIFQAVSVGIL